jgi:hypothetical protein
VNAASNPLSPLASSDAPAPPAPPGFRPRLSGHCACCGAETGSLFAMGHDARFRGGLQRALAAGSWDNRVDWFVDGSTHLQVTVTVALASVAALIGRDWTDKVVAGASRLARRPVTAAPSRPTLPTDRDVPATAGGFRRASDSPSGEFNPVDTVEERVDELMRKLGRPMVGKWGWLDLRLLIDADPAAFDVPGARPARVVQTHRDPELDPGAWKIDVFVPGMRKTFVDVDPTNFRVDESARLS